MPSIDERVVAMSFENDQFEAKVTQTMGTLGKLDAAIKNVGAVNGLEGIQASADKVTLEKPMSAMERLKAALGRIGEGATEGFTSIERAADRVSLLSPLAALDKLKAKFGSGVAQDAADAFGNVERSADKVELSGMTRAIDTVSAKFSTMQMAAAVALGNIATQAISKGTSFAKSFGFGPIQDGLSEYETNLNSIQTIMANTQGQQVSGLAQVNSHLNELNKYSDQTIYNFSEMAKNIGTFTAAGVDMDTATQSIKGIANLAALSGSNSVQASNAMYQLSQAIAAGKVSLQDWNSVVTANMGGAVFQKALWNTAKAMGTLKDVPMGQTFEEWKKAGNTFRNSLSAVHKEASSGATEVAKAQKDAAETIKAAEESAAESVQNAHDRVIEAKKGVSEAAKSTAEAVAAANEHVSSAEAHVGEVARQSAEAIATAQGQVAEAQQGVTEAAQQSATGIQEAIKAQHEAVVQSAADVASALNGVTEARKALDEAMKPTSADDMQAAQDSLETAQLDQADLADAVAKAQQEQKRSSEDLAAVQARLAELVKAGADPSQIQAAQRAVEDAQTRATDAADAQERALLRQRAAARGVTEAQEALTEAQQKGTDSDKNVQGAKDALTKSLDDYKAAQESARDTAIAAEDKVKQARQEGAKLQEDASKRLVAAEQHVSDVRQESAQKQKEASQQLIDAEKEVTKAREDGAAKQADAEANLIKAQKDEVKATQDAQKRIADAHEQAAERIQAAKTKGGGEPKSWLTSDVLTGTLKQFTGEMTDAQLKAQGFTDAQIKAIQQTAKTAQDAATKIKTLHQLFDVVRESIGSGWAQTFQIIFGNFTEAKDTFTAMSKPIGQFVSANANARNKVLADWKKLGGRTELIKGIQKMFEDLIAVIKPVRDAFREVFPAKTGKDLVAMTKGFSDFMDKLKIGPETADNLKRTFAGLFAVLHIGWTVFKELVKAIGSLLGAFGEGSGGILSFTGSIGDMLVAFDNAVTKGGAIHGIFTSLAAVVKVPLKLLGLLTTVIGNIFSGGEGKKAEDIGGGLDKITKAAGPLRDALEFLTKAWEKFTGMMEKVKAAVEPWLGKAADAFSNFGQIVANAFNNINWDTAFGALQTGLIAGLFLTIRKALKKGIGVDVGGGMLSNLSKVFGALTGKLQIMQQNIKANILLKIAAAIGILAVAVALLSSIDPQALQRGMTAMAVGMGELVGALAMLSKVTKGAGFATLPIVAASLVALSVAMLIMAGAVKVFATMKWEELVKGLAGVAGSLVAIGLGVKLIGPSVIPSALALIPLGIALNIIAVAVKQFASMNIEELAKGIGAIAVALGSIGLAMKLMPANMLITGPALVAVAFAMTLLAGAVGAFGNMDLGTLAKGIGGIAVALVAIGLAISAIPPTVALQAAGLVILGVALGEMAGAIGMMGNLNLGTIVKGIAAFAGILVVLAVGLTAMAGTLPGSAALLAAAAALAILAPTLALLGNLEWGTIVKGLVAIAAVLGTLALVGALVAEPLAALGIALLPLAGVMLITGVAAMAFGTALKLMGDNGTKAVATITVAILAFVASLPKIVTTFLAGLVDIAAEMAKIAPKIFEALGTILANMATFIVNQAPNIAAAVTALITAFLQVITDNFGPIMNAGISMLLQFLKGIADNVGKITEQVAAIITGFMGELTKQLPNILTSGYNLLKAFLKGIADHIQDVLNSAGTVIANFLQGITNQIPKVAPKAANLIVTFLHEVAKHLDEVIRAGTDVVVAVIEGIGNALPRIVKSATHVAEKFMHEIGQQAKPLADAGFNMLIDFLNGLAASIRQNHQRLVDAGVNIAEAIIDAMVDSLGAGGKLIKYAVDKLFDMIPGWAKKILGIHSPSSVFYKIGTQTIQGFSDGIGAAGATAVSSIRGTATDVVDAAADVLSQVPDMLAGEVDMNPTITPVLDLSEVHSGSREMGRIIESTPSVGLTPSTSTDSAEHVSTGVALSSRESGVLRSSLVFNQNNYSPESLTPVEIYRHTRNQLAQVKTALGVPSA